MSVDDAWIVAAVLPLSALGTLIPFFLGLRRRRGSKLFRSRTPR